LLPANAMLLCLQAESFVSERISQSIDRDLAEQLQVFDTRFLLAIHHGRQCGPSGRLRARDEPPDGWQWSVVGFAEVSQALGV